MHFVVERAYRASFPVPPADENSQYTAGEFLAPVETAVIRAASAVTRAADGDGTARFPARGAGRAGFDPRRGGQPGAFAEASSVTPGASGSSGGRRGRPPSVGTPVSKLNNKET
jgi:hypothetical protein